MYDIESIKARIEIGNLKARHLRMLDTKDWAGFAALLTEDFVLDISQGTNIPPIHGRDAAVKQVQASIGATLTVHQAHPPEFDFKGDEAQVAWAMQDRIVRGADQPSLSGYGHHHDRWVRSSGEWKLASQRLTRLHVDILPPASAKQTQAAGSTNKQEKEVANDLETLKAWQQLSEAKARYCRTLDTKDWAGFADLLTEDFVLDVSQASSLPIINGRDAALKQVQSSILTARTAHQVHSPEIELKGDEAQVIWAMQDRVVWGPERPSITGYGHYHERWVRRNGTWKLAAQRLTRLHVDVHPATST